MPGKIELEKMRAYFDSGVTQSYQFRIKQLGKLKAAILENEQAIYQALYDDLKKSPEETWVTETGFVLAELNQAMKKLKDWMHPEPTPTNLVNLPSSSWIMREPLGVVLIIGPWNYPFQLLINPLVGAIAAGNCVVLKPSEFATATEKVMAQIISNNFEPEYICYSQGEGSVVVPQMMKDFRFDHVFYTGSTHVGSVIYKMAAEKLVPVTLELGGKSPCVVEADANIKVAARRIALTKFSNAGQMCASPDYVLVHESVKEKFIEQLKICIKQFFGESVANNEFYGKIINTKQFDRITEYIKNGTVLYGGNMDRDKLFIEPTILNQDNTNDAVMKDEIFGPVLPVISFSEMEEAQNIIKQNPNPLSFYIYTSSKKKENEWLSAVPAGGACVNNSSWHLTNHFLPFGGRGSSGMGNYHGHYSFETFSHRKSVMKTPSWFDPAIKYPPFKGKLRLFKWLIR